MMAFFRQFQLLLWKNGLTVIRQPVWSVTLIAWPLIIFIILAVTRHQFPPIVRETCYVAPRNLPSTGLFPFLQTLMCNTDSSCNNKSHLVEPTTSKPRNARSLKDSSPLESLSQVGDLLNLLPSNISNEEAELLKVLDILGSPYEGSPENAALRTFFNITGLENQEPENLLKRAFCTVALPMLNQTSPDIFTYGVLMFCMTNSTVLEVSLYTLDQILTELMLTQPEELMKVAGGAVTLFDQLQNDPLLWDSLLDLPRLFSGDGVDQWLSNTEGLLRNLQSVVTVIQNNIPETNGSLSKVHSVLAGGIDVMNYVTHWPGKNVTIPLREIVTNDSVGTVMKYLVEDVLDYRIPLDKAVGLMLDKDVVRSHLCDNSSNIFWSAAACSSGIVDKVLQAISPEKVAKQVFLVWSHDVAKHDVRFAKGLLHSLTGDSSSGAQDGSNITRVRRSTETPPQNAEEELFLNIGQGVMEFVQLVPEVDMVVQSILQTGFQSITLATVTVDTVEEILSNVLKDANQLQMAYHVLLTNESETSAWLGRVFDSVMEVAMKMMSPGNVNCEDLLAPLEWLLSSNSIKNEVWKAMICPSNNSLTQALLSDWMPLIQKAQDLYSIPTGRADFNVTLSMILSEWHRLYRNSIELSELLYSASEEMGEEYWKNWMPDNNTQINTGTLQKSFVWFLISLGERIENSDLWPTVKDYFYMSYWILNYSPDVTTQPANCSFNMNSSALHCDADLSWPQFVQTVTQALMSPSDALVNWLKGSVNLLQHVYGDIYQHLAASYVKQEITGGDALSDYLINLMNNLNDFLSMISRVPNQNITNPDDMIPHIGNLLESVGLSPLVPLLSNEHPLDASEILDVASKLGRLNQDVFTFDETDTNVSQLEERIKEFLSLEFNLTLSLPQIMGHTLLTYSQYLDPAEVNRLIKAIQPFDNQTSAGFVEAVISAVELLKTLTDSPNGDPTNIILGYIHQIQEFLVSLCRLQKIEPVVLPSGQNTTAQVTDLDLILMEFLNLFTPESLQNLSQVAPDVAQDIVIQKFVAFLPKEVQSDATHFLQDFTALQSHVTECTAGEGCLAEISEIFTFLDQILDLMLTANGNVTIEIAPTSSIPGGGEYEDNAATFFSLLLPPNDTAHLETFKQTLEFIKLVMNTPNITVSAVQNALTQSNLTIEDLNATAALAEAANIEKLMANIKALTSAEKCFEPQNDMMETTQCVVGLINVFSIFLTQVPSLYNNTAILSLIPVIVNKTINDFTHVNFDSNPNMALVDSLSLTLANIKMSLEQSQMNTSEIMNEIKVVEGLIQLIANMQLINTTQMDPVHVQRVYLELVEWYLKRLENISSDSAISVLLHPIFSITQMQVALQLSQTDFSLFVSDKVQMLINSLQGSVNGTDLSKIGQTTTEILRHLLDLINFNLESWSNIEGSEEQFNTTILQSTELQIKQYLSLIEKWMKEPNVPVLLSSMLQWENSTMATPVTDLNQLQQTMADFLSEDQRAYLSIISNITDFLNKAVMVAEQHGLQDEGFVAAIIEAVESAMQIPSMTNISLPLPEQQDFLEIVQETLNLILHPNTSFDLSIVILRNAEKIIQQAVPEMVSEYLLGALRFVTAYFESIYEANGQETLNQIIFNELKTLESLLSQNSTAQPYVSALINITQLILESGQDNTSLWEGFENASADNLQQIVHQLGKLVTRFWPLVAEGIGSRESAPSLEAFTALAPLLENVLTGKADQDTWNKLEQMLETLLSALEGTELWNNLTSAIPQFEKVVETLVKNMQGENVVIQSLQNSILDLMTEAVQSSNSTDLNVSEVLEKMQLAIESTVQALQQANGTLECSEILKVWEPVIEAAELSPDTIALWCNTSLQPILEAYASIQNDHSQMNMSMIMGPTSVSDTAARIVEAVQSLYQVNIDRALVVNQFIMMFYDRLSMLAGQSLSPEAQLYWLKQLQDTQLQYSLSSIKMLSDELLDVDPALQPYTEALVNALSHILDNYDFLQQSEPPKELLEEAAMIFLSSANITSHDVFSMMERNSSASLNDLITEIIGLVINMKAFGDEPMIYQALEQYLASNGTSLITQKVAEMSLWLASTEASGLDLLNEALSKSYDILRPILSALSRMSMDMRDTIALLEDVAGNITMFRQLLSNSSPLGVMDQHPSDSEMTAGYQTPLVRRRRDVSLTMTRNPMEDFIDLFYIDYPAMFRAMAVPPTTPEIVETAHVFFANPNLNVVMKGASSNMQWGWNASREETIDSALEVFSLLTHPDVFEMSSMDLLKNMSEMLPDALPYSSAIKRVTRVLANESQANLMLMQEIIQSVRQLLHISPTDPQFKGNLDNLTSQVCTLERTESADLLMQSLNVEPGQLCRTFLPALQILAEALVTNTTAMADIINQAVVGDPRSYSVSTDWTAVLSQILGFNISSLSSLNVNASSPEVTFGEMLRNKTAFVMDVQQRMGLDPAALHLLTNTTLPNDNLVILSWLLDLRYCNSTPPANMTETDLMRLTTLCSLSPEQWYKLSVLTTRHVNTEKVMYKMVLSEDIQSAVGVMLQMAKAVTNMVDKMSPAVNKLQGYLKGIESFKMSAKNKLSDMAKGQRASMPSQASFVMLSRALCSNGIIALFGISKLPTILESHPSFSNNPQREEMIERFKLPRNATPFCMNMYLDMVNTTGGAIAWAFLKPMLMGRILYTPDTPTTRAIMERANTTLQDFANVRKFSEDWIKSTTHLFSSAQKLEKTLPMLQNSLGNPFVKHFIEMQTGINIGRLEKTLSNFSNMTMMLDNNKDVLNQITTLSTLMVDISSCIMFDRYRGFDSADELNSAAQALAKDRNLYASVIFKLPKDADSSRNKRDAASSTSSLPPQVSYTIRMHMDNVMRTDRVRNPYFVKDTHISARNTMRYNRGFIYLQESIDRAIIETQTGQRVTDTAVQLQPFPYPCYQRDEYLEAISFVFPLMLMIAWVLFIADFVKKLVHERELRLHEYMKMMGVNTLSHFFAWFVECATYLLTTIIIMTLVLKYGKILPNSDGFLIFLYLCDYGLSIIAFSYLVSAFFDKTYIAGLSGSLLYILCFFPFIIVSALEGSLTFFQKSALGLFSPTCFSYASQYASRYEAQGEGMQWSNSYTSPLAGDTASFGWLCWLMLIDSILYFIIGAYIRTVFPGQYGIAAPWYFPFKPSFWADLCCIQSKNNAAKGRLFTNIMQSNQPAFNNDKGKGKSALSTKAGEDFSDLPVGVALHRLTKTYGDQVAIENLNVSFYEGHVTSLLGHNGAGKTTTMSLLTGLYAPSSGSIEVYGKDMQTNIDRVRKELGVCMQYDVLFDHMTTKEHLLLYGQIKAPHWSHRELREQVRTILEDTGMYAHRHKLVGTLSGGMKRKLSISIAFIGGSRLVVLDEPTTGVDPCSRRSIWDIVIQHKKNRTIIMSTHHLDEAEVLSDRIAFLERGGLKCCGSPFYLKDKLGQGYKLTLTKKMQNTEGERVDSAELKAFVQAHVPQARLKEAQGNDLVYSLPPFNSSNASSYRSLLTALDSNLNALQLGGYGISDTTLEEVFLQLTQGHRELGPEDGLMSISETVSDTISVDSFSSDSSESGNKIKLSSPSTVTGMALAWQQISAILIKRFHHSRRDWKGLISQILLPVLFVVCAMGLGSIRNDVQHYPELQLSPALYNIGASYSFFSSQNPNSSRLADAMTSFPGMDTACFDKPDNPICTRNTNQWSSRGNSSKGFSVCKCTRREQICDKDNYQPPHKKIPSSQIVYNLSGINVENYLVATANDFIRNRYGGFDFGVPLPADLKMDITAVPGNRTLSKVWFNPEGHHTMPAYLNSLNNLILRSSLPADKDPRKYAISVYSQPYFGRADDEDTIVQGLLHVLVAMCVLTGFSITTASFAIYEVTEHQTGSKRLQHIAGISEPLYWTVNFLYDMIIYLIPVAATIAVIAAFQIPAFTERQNLGAITLLLFLFGFSTFPWMYLLAGVFKDAEMAFISYVCINLFISVNTILSTSILYFLGQISMHNPEAIQKIFHRLSNAFLIFPQFSFGNGLMELARSDIEVQILSGYGIDAYKNPFSTDALGWMFFSSLIQGLVFFVLRLLVNRSLIRKVRRLICHNKTVPQVARDEDEDEDEDVAAEHLRVSSGAANSDILQVNGLSKVYKHFTKKVHAVKKLSVGIPAGECFGLLGVNGAGKTTTFKMLTGDISPTDGTAQIRDWDGRLVDIMECRKQGINIGYCPQVDALDNLLTGEEHLYFYARIRGISKRETDRVVNYLLKRLQLNYHRNIITDGYSCGTRRKLSTALALIGHPQILLLDEPSSGMDPRTKRHLWKIISEEVKGKCAVVLTSHSMEECEALCSRLAIMVKGQFRCLGSLQHIKNRFGSGFTVKMYLAEASCDVEKITSFMQRRFPSTCLKDQHSTVVEYHVLFAPGGLADIFDQLESNKNALQIKHFSVSQTTLDEVFINFAMGKIGMETIPIDSDDESDSLDSIKEVQT